MKKSRAKWILIALLLALLAAGALRTVASRKAQSQALQTQQTAGQVQATLRLAPHEQVRVQSLTLVQSLPLSGALKAVNTAFVKAKVAGELQGLSLREGERVHAGQVLGRIDPTEAQARLRQAQEQASAARAQRDMAQRTLDNNRALVAQGFISATALDASLNSFNAAQASYQAAQAGVDLAQKMLEDTTLRAPISGLIAQRLAQPGERVPVEGRVVEIVDLSRLELEASLSAQDAMQVKVGQTATLQVEGASTPLEATVARINPSAQASSRAVLVYLALQKTEGLRQGLFAQGALHIGTQRALALPLSAVRTDKPQTYVQWIDQGKVAHQPVTLGVRGRAQGAGADEGGGAAEDMVAIEGLPEGAPVLRGSVGAVIAGTPVQPVAATPEGAK